MRTLVTGGGGFLGRYIVEQLLARGDSVTVFARGDYAELEQIGARTMRGDVQDAEAITQACVGMEVVFHVAALAGMAGRWESFYGSNVVGTQNVIVACQAQNVPRLVYTSSPSVVFDNRSHEGCDESLPYPAHYESHYAHSKALGEQIALQAQGLLAVALRPHLLWGPRDTHLLPALIARARSGRVIQVGDGTNEVDLTYVEDAARAHLLAADALEPGSPVAGAAYFISQDEPVNLWEWINNFLAQLGLPPVRRRVSLPVARAIGGALELAYRLLRLQGDPTLTRFMASELATSHYYDISRAKLDFGYRPQFSMAAGLHKTVAFLQNN